MFAWLKEERDERLRQGLHRQRRRLGSCQGPVVRLAGSERINFSTNDYLGLANDRRLAVAASRAARRYGCGAAASALVSGYLPPLRHLENALKCWQKSEAALVLSSGYAANLAVLSALVRPGDALFSDALNHASLIDGCRMSRASVHIYRHADTCHLEELLGKTSSTGRKWIVTDSVFSMDGDIAPIRRLGELAIGHDALLILDEAHATGVLGPEGRGLSGLLPEEAQERLIKIGTLSKALGSQGGFVCAPRIVIEALINTARPYVFSTALAPPLAAAARKALDLVREEPQRQAQVLKLAERLRTGLVSQGFPPSTSSTPIIPILVGESEAAVSLSKRLQKAGFLVPAIRPPSVPPGTARLRVSLTAAHTQDQVDQLLAALAALGYNTA